MKRYNYNTKKIYESTAVYKLSVEEFDAQGNSVENNSFEDTYTTLEDALEDSYEIMTNVSKSEGIDEDDVEFVQNDDNVVFTAPDGRKWVFSAEVSQNEEVVSECGDVAECDNAETEDASEEEVAEEENESVKESVSARFARLRKMFESEEDDEDSSEDDKKEDDAEEKKDDAGVEDSESDDKESDDEKKEDDGDEEMKAVIVTVKKDDAEKCKDEMIAAGIAEDDIEILDGDDESENADIRVDVNSVMELKDYLAKKGVDLEEEIGGEIVSDDEEDSDSEEENQEGDKNGEGEDDENFDFDNLGDIFGAEDEE